LAEAQKHLTFYELDLGLNHVARKWTEPVDNGANHLIAVPGGGDGPGGVLGRAVQVDPIKPALKAPGTKRLELIYDGPLSDFAFKFKLRRYTSCAPRTSSSTRTRATPTCGQGLTLVHVTAQLELCVTQDNTLHTLYHPLTPAEHGLHNHYAHPLYYTNRSC